LQYARPFSDVENPGGWTTEPLWDKIEEEPFDDGDFAHSPKTATEDSFTVGLSLVTDPQVHTGHVVRIRAQAGVSGTFKYELMQGAVVIKDSGNVVLTTSFAEYNMTLSEAEAANITDYAALRVRVTAVITQKNQYQDVSWIRVDIPDLAGEEHSGTGSISGNGSIINTIKKGGLGSAVKSVGGTLLIIGLVGMLGIASITSGGSQFGAGKKAVTAIADISSTGSQFIIGKKDVSDSIGISGGGSVIATGVKAEGEIHFGIASILGNGVLTGIGKKQGAADVTISVNGTLSGTGEKQNRGDSIVTGGGSVIVIGEKSEEEAHSGTAMISGNGGVDAIVIKKALGDLVISGSGSIITGEHSGITVVSGNGILIGVTKNQTLADLVILGGGSIITTNRLSKNGILIALGKESVKEIKWL